ncbi:MAG: transposase, partial [Desulfovibrio sp.]|nr:transposase [Desulfovibrio sp.]
TLKEIKARLADNDVNHYGVIGKSHGVAVHDCWGSYWKYDNVEHATCAAHLLRELEGVQENAPDHTWSQAFKSLLMRMKHQKELDMASGKTEAGVYHRNKFSRLYDQAKAECLRPETKAAGRGRPKLGKERSLIERLAQKKEDDSWYFSDYRVSFDNNQAERDLRNCKTKVKVIGCFRTKGGAQDYCAITSFLSTGQKHGIGASDSLTAWRRYACLSRHDKNFVKN